MCRHQMSRPCVDDGRMPFSRRCRGGRRKSNASAVSLVRSGHPEWAFPHNAPGFCPVCRVNIELALDIHMMGSHLELGQLWRCPVEWCAVRKGSVRDCLGHFKEKHGGMAFFALKNVSKFFSPWTVTRDVWQPALRPDVSGIAVDTRLFHEAGCRLVHKDPFPHPAFLGGGDSSTFIFRGPGYSHCPAHTAQYFDSCVGGAPGSGTGGMFSRWHVGAGVDKSSAGLICQ